jgi:hypothetical protein
MPTERESPTETLTERDPEAPTDPETPSETETPSTVNRTGTDMPMATATEALTTQGTRPSSPEENLPNRVAAKKKTNEKNAIYFIQFVAEIRLIGDNLQLIFFFVFGLIYFPFILRKVLLKVQLGMTHRWIKIKKVFAMFLKYLEHQTCISVDCKIRKFCLHPQFL